MLSLKFAASAFLLLTASAAVAQTTDECEKLKIDNAKLKFENANLKKGIIARSPATAPVQTSERAAAGAVAPTQGAQQQTLYKIDFALVKCQGNAKAQTVTVTLLLTNKDANKTVYIYHLSAIDDQADERKTNGAEIGSGGSNNVVTTGVPVKAVFIIPRILPTVKSLSLFTCGVHTSVGEEFRETNVEFRNVAISWK